MKKVIYMCKVCSCTQTYIFRKMKDIGFSSSHIFFSLGRGSGLYGTCKQYCNIKLRQNFVCDIFPYETYERENYRILLSDRHWCLADLPSQVSFTLECSTIWRIQSSGYTQTSEIIVFFSKTMLPLTRHSSQLQFEIISHF